MLSSHTLFTEKHFYAHSQYLQ